MEKPEVKLVDIGGHEFDLRTRATLVRSLPKGLVGAEVGVQRGWFARCIFNGCKPSLMYLVDCWEVNPGIKSNNSAHLEALREAAKGMSKEICEGTVRLVVEWSEKAAEWVPDGSLDWVYIDADHSLEGIRSDLKAWGPKVKAGGWIMGHDFNRIGICEGVNEYTTQRVYLDEQLNHSFIFVKE